MNRWQNWPPLPNQKKGAVAWYDGYGWRVLAPGTAGVLTTHGAAAPTWSTIAGGASVVYIPFGSEIANGQTYAP